MILRLLTAWARRHADDLDEPLNIPEWPESDEPATPYIPEPDPREIELETAWRQRDQAQAQIAELGEEIRELIATVGQRTIERDALADELEHTKAQLDAAHRALAGESPRYVDRAMETPPPPTSDRAAYLREKARADALARRLAEAEAELRAIRYPREGFECVLIEQDPTAVELIKARLSKAIQPALTLDIEGAARA